MAWMMDVQRGVVPDLRVQSYGPQQVIGLLGRRPRGIRAKPQSLIERANAHPERAPQKDRARDTLRPHLRRHDPLRTACESRRRVLRYIEQRATGDAVDARMPGEKLSNAGENVGVVPAIIIRKRDDGARRDVKSRVAAARQPAWMTQVMDRERTAVPVDEPLNVVAFTLVDDDRFEIAQRLLAKTFEQLGESVIGTDRRKDQRDRRA